MKWIKRLFSKKTEEKKFDSFVKELSKERKVARGLINRGTSCTGPR